VSGTMELYDRIVDKRLLVRRLWVSANHVRNEDRVLNDDGGFRQMELFEDFACKTPGITDKTPVIADNGKKLRSAQEAALKIRQRYGNNAILKGTDFKEGATLIERNRQIGGHRA
ncbi:MAG: DNA methylase, partial [Lachnospiraceae bacterium]|nr:DNA methylase [Lachnospiraceae bacterium]